MSGCAIPGCTDPCRSGQLMCRWHWKKVTPELRAAVIHEWRNVQDRSSINDRTDAGLAARLQVIRKYQAAKQAAVDHVCALEGLTIQPKEEAAR